jgi:hypothetical protein
LKDCGKKPNNARKTYRYRPITTKHLASSHLLADLGNLRQGFAKFHLDSSSSDAGTVTLHCKVMDRVAIVKLDSGGTNAVQQFGPLHSSKCDGKKIMHRRIAIAGTENRWVQPHGHFIYVVRFSSSDAAEGWVVSR